jgi:hypothetical protein
MKINTIEKGRKILNSIEAEHFADRSKIATGDLKTPTELVQQDLDIVLENLKKKSKEEARKIRFADHSCGFGTSLFLVKEKLLEKGIDERYVVEKQLFGMDIDADKILMARLVIDPERRYNTNIQVGDSTRMTFETKGITHSWNNEPYLKADRGRTPVYPEIIKNVDKQNPVQDSETHLLPKSISLSDDKKYLLSNFFQKGLEHWREWSINAFNGAKVRTVSYICNKGYEHNIKIWQDGKFLFDFDFRKLGYIINGGSLFLTQLLVDIREKNPNPLFVRGTKRGPMDTHWEAFNDIKDEPFKNSIPVLKTNRAEGFDPKENLGYISNSLNVDYTDFNKIKLVCGYRPSGEELGSHKLGTMNVIPAGILIQPKDRWMPFENEKQAKNRKFYLKSPIVENWKLKRSRTQPTLDAAEGSKGFNQLKFVDNIDPDLYLTSNDDIIDYLSKKYSLKKKTKDEILHQSKNG